MRSFLSSKKYVFSDAIEDIAERMSRQELYDYVKKIGGEEYVTIFNAPNLNLLSEKEVDDILNDLKKIANKYNIKSVIEIHILNGDKKNSHIHFWGESKEDFFKEVSEYIKNANLSVEDNFFEKNVKVDNIEIDIKNDKNFFEDDNDLENLIKNARSIIQKYMSNFEQINTENFEDVDSIIKNSEKMLEKYEHLFEE